MSLCPACGQPAPPPRIAGLIDRGFDALEHCLFKVIYEESIMPCAGRDNPKILRCCQLCGVSKQFGTWKPGRTGPVFEAMEAK